MPSANFASLKTPKVLVQAIVLVQVAFAVPSPDLPGIEITDSEIALERSQTLVQKESQQHEDIYQNKGWIAPSLEEQMNQDETFIGMGQGAIFVPRLTESRLEPEYTAIKIDSLSKEYLDKEWTGKPGIRLAVPFGDYKIIIGSGSKDKQLEYNAKVEEGKTTLIPPNWGGLIINTINEDGEYVSENYEIFELNSGLSYGKGFGLTQERINDVKTWILQPQMYRISRSGENASSILNYITVQVNPGELSHVELVFEESTGRLIAGGVQRMRINASKNSYWTYGLRIGGSASYTTLIAANDQKSYVWNAYGDLRLRMLYNRNKVFWLTELYTRENMQWLSEESKDSQWNVAQDMLQFQSSVVYKFLSWIGPYTRVNVKTHIFPEYYINIDSTMRIVKTANDTVQFSEDKIRMAPPFDPIRIGEGFGLNLHPMIFSFADISAQTGFAARQTIRKNLLLPVSVKNQIVFVRTTDNIRDYGWENSLNIKLSFRAFTFDLVGEIFFPNAEFKNYLIEELSADLRFALTRFLEISYQQQLIDRIAAGYEEAKSERFESLNTVQLRLYVNF
ncbi:MAG: hypothetical protein LBH25_12625 [Fibromonadaceae bacterium]|jgi:hypothetical protein|nr:hypothetical protein [Fibromonadaceae bacterium]